MAADRQIGLGASGQMPKVIRVTRRSLGPAQEGRNIQIGLFRLLLTIGRAMAR